MPRDQEREAGLAAPDYAGASVTALVPSLLGIPPYPAEGAAWLPAECAGARAVVLLLVDGFGWEAWLDHGDRLPAFSSMSACPLTTVVPSTTAAALTSITTGLAPSQHGVIGFRVRLDDVVVNMLTWQVTHGRRAPDPLDVQRHAQFGGRDVPVVTRAEYRATAFTKMHLRDGTFVGWSAPSSIALHCASLVAGGSRFVYAYYPGPDTVAHQQGLLDGFYTAELVATDRLVGDVLAALGGDVALLVTSDHGQVHLEPEGWLGIERVEPLVECCSGDGRFRYLHARRGAAGELRQEAATAFGDDAWVLSRDELLASGWLGPDPSPATRRRLGDVVLAARGPVAFVDPAFPQEARIRSAHGSVTTAEMLVPLFAARGRG